MEESGDIQDDTVRNLRKNMIFLSSKLDDANLSMAAFRIYAHISRRGGNGDAFPSAESMAKICRMNKDTVWRALKELTDRGMLKRINHPGRSNSYRLTSCNDWDCIDIEDAPSQAEKEGEPLQSSQPPFSSTPDRPFPVPGGCPSPVPGDGKGGSLRYSNEGNPTKGIQIRKKQPREARATIQPDAYDAQLREIIRPDLQTSQVLEAWHSFVEYRNQHRMSHGKAPISPLSEIAAKAALKKLASAKKATNLIAAITDTINGDWDGIGIYGATAEGFYKS